MSLVTPILDDEGRGLLDTIDDLRRLTQISHEIAIPRVIVVGQQSSGKSSVLGAITHVPFPTESGLSTRFAIEIVCRRSSINFTRSFIAPYEEPDQDKQQRLDAFETRWSESTFDTAEQIATLIQEAEAAIGFSEPESYSYDKVVIEKHGPSQEHLTIIDLPGLISSGKHELTVAGLVSSYVEQEQTIILAIANGLLDRVNQRLFALQEHHWKRAIGVFTWADLIDWKGNGGALIKNQVSNPNLLQPEYGWHIVRNLKSEEVRAGADRDTIEDKFFQEKSKLKEWEGMEKVPYGIAPLRQKLGHILQETISHSLPEMKIKIEEAIQKHKATLRSLGEDRTTVAQQKQYLTESARLLKDRVRDALEGRSNPLDLSFKAISLRDKVRTANEAFAAKMLAHGHTWNVTSDKVDDEIKDPKDALNADRSQPFSISMQSLVKYFAQTVSKYQGRALRGTFDPIWVGNFFRQKSYKWKQIVSDHAENVSDIVENELASLVMGCVSGEVGENIFATIYEPHLLQRRHRLQEKVQELLSPYLSPYPATLNRRYEEELTKYEASTKVKHASAASDATDLNFQTGLQIYRCVVLYYGVAINVLLDNVQSLAVENILLRGLEDIFPPESVGDMKEQQLGDLAAESPEIADQRRLVKRKLHDFEHAKKLIAARRPNGLPHSSPARASALRMQSARDSSIGVVKGAVQDSNDGTLPEIRRIPSRRAVLETTNDETKKAANESST